MGSRKHKQTSVLIGSPEEYVHRHTLSIMSMLTQMIGVTLHVAGMKPESANGTECHQEASSSSMVLGSSHNATLML